MDFNLRKTQARQACLAWRSALPPTVHQAAQSTLINHCLASFSRGDRVGLYWPVNGEVPVMAMLPAAFHLGVALYWPKVPDQPQPLSFVRWHPGLAMDEHAWGMYEPRGKVTDASDLTALLVPALALDAEGYRLGMGGGWYDRTLSAAPELRSIGVVYDQQVVARLPRDDWDVPVQEKWVIPTQGTATLDLSLTSEDRDHDTASNNG